MTVWMVGIFAGTFDSATGTYTVEEGVSSDGIDPGVYTVGQTYEIDGAQYLIVGYSNSGFVARTPSERDDYFTSDDVSEGDTFAITTSGSFTVTESGLFTACFLEGTLIACPEGERAVESLAIGDLVLTASGEVLPVRWVGRQTLASRFADPLHSYPVRIAAGTLGAGLPLRDLFVSPSHAMLLDGVLVQAHVLLNGSTITQVKPQAAHFTYFHIEFEAHAVVLAEGAPAESFADSNKARARFDNFAEFAARYGSNAIGAEPCDLPRVTCARQLPHRLRRLLPVPDGAVRVA